MLSERHGSYRKLKTIPTRHFHDLIRLNTTKCIETTRHERTMARFPRFTFLALAVAFHSVYIASIFDIYFVSPIVSGMRLFGVERQPWIRPPADRLVLIVGMRPSSRFLSTHS